jgi:hypothetical protein
VKRSVTSGIHSIDLGTAFHQKLGHFNTWEEGKFTIIKQILTLDSIILHDTEMQEGIASCCPWVNLVDHSMQTSSDIQQAAILVGSLCV